MCKVSNIGAMLFRVVIILIVTIFVSKSSCQKDIVEELKERYYDESTECFDAQNETQPIYKCSGIIVRGVKNLRYQKKFAWSLKPLDKERNSFSFGFLRQDFLFSRLGMGYDAGFIIYPHLSTPSKKKTQKVLCGFPTDAYTDSRSDRGCGLTRIDTTQISQQCDTQNITTFTQWLSHYNRITNNEDQCSFIGEYGPEPRMVCGYVSKAEEQKTNPLQPTPDEDDADDLENRFALRQCGFDLSNSNAARNFAVIREANHYLKKDPFSSELKFEGWDESNAKQIPIQAFFYFMGTHKGYKNALKYQSDFYTESGGEEVPIVGIRLPTKSYPDIHIQNADVNS